MDIYKEGNGRDNFLVKWRGIMDILKNLLDGDDIYFYIFKSKEELEEYKFKNINHKYTEIDTKPTGSS